MVFRRNVALGSRLELSTWRKSAIGTWDVVGDSQIYAMISLDVGPMLEYIKNHPCEKLTLTHVAGKASGIMIDKFPQINSIIRFGNLYPRKDIGVFFQVAPDKEGKDLTGMTIKDIHKKSLQQIVDEMRPAVKTIRSGNDESYKKVKNSLKMIPGFLITPVIRFLGFLLYTLNIWTPSLGTPQDSFGSMMITNIGSLGMQRAWAPLVPWSRVPLLMALGKVYDRPVVKDGEIVVQKTIDCCFTLDHRVIDGVLGAKMAKHFEFLFTNPHLLEKETNS
jgi:pyruvate/2-oxoglutarate dehydrogenase complex dihydrolipoamide acyltransferase (E2) component